VVREAIADVLRELGDRSVEDLIALPAMTDAGMRAALALISRSLPAAARVDVRLMDLMVCRSVSLSLRYGNAPYSSHGFATFGLVLGHYKEWWERAHDLGRVARGLAERHGLLGSSSATLLLA
jgi:predicted ATPase